MLGDDSITVPIVVDPEGDAALVFRCMVGIDYYSLVLGVLANSHEFDTGDRMAVVVRDQLMEADLVIAGSVQNTENTDNNVEFGAVATVGGCL